VKSFNNLVVATAIAGSGLMGGVIGAAVMGANTIAASAATATPSATGTPGAGFKPNEDPTHEAGESAAREAQENAGTAPTVP
jgi:hypothetical protein